MEVADPKYTVSDFKSVKELYAALLVLIQNTLNPPVPIPANQFPAPPTLNSAYSFNNVAFPNLGYFGSNNFLTVLTVGGAQGAVLEYSHDGSDQSWFPCVMINTTTNEENIYMNILGNYVTKFPSSLNNVRLRSVNGQDCTVVCLAVYASTFN